MISAWQGKTLPQELFEILDSLVFFEGERPLLELLRTVGQGGELGEVPSLAFRAGGEVRYTEIEEGGPPISEVPYPDFGVPEKEEYLSPRLILPVAASRGCYWRRCSFCSRQHLQHSFRQRTPSAIVDELAFLQQRHGASDFFFVDECISPGLLSRLADELLARSLDIRWSCYSRFESGLDNDELCQRLFRSGLRMIYFGLESACPRILDLMRKGTPPKTISRILRATDRAGILNMVLYFVGFPTETREEALETCKFLLAHEDQVAFAIAGKFMLEESSPIFRNPEEFGVTKAMPLSPSADLTVIYRHETGVGMTDTEIDSVQAYVNERTQHLQSAEMLNRSHLLLLGQSYVKRSRRAADASREAVFLRPG